MRTQIYIDFGNIDFENEASKQHNFSIVCFFDKWIDGEADEKYEWKNYDIKERVRIASPHPMHFRQIQSRFNHE